MLPLEPFSWTIFSHEIRAGWKVWRFWVASFLSVRLIWGEVYLSRSQNNSLCVDDGACRCSRPIDNRLVRISPHQWVTDSEVFSPDAFVEGEDDQGCGGDRGDGSGIEGDVLEGLEVLDQGVGPLGGSPH